MTTWYSCRSDDVDEDAAFEQRIARLKTAKGEMPMGESRKASQNDKGGV